MAEKILEKVELVVSQDLTAISGLRGVVNAVCYSPDLDARFGVSMPLTGFEEIIGNVKKALVTYLEDDDKHTVSERTPPEPIEVEAEE